MAPRCSHHAPLFLSNRACGPRLSRPRRAPRCGGLDSLSPLIGASLVRLHECNRDEKKEDLKGQAMRKIVDSNYMQSPKLRAYLAESRKNIAVVTDYAAMEAFKGNTLVSIFRSMEVLSEFPQQVLVLKSTGSINTLKGRRCGMTRRMIDKDQTKGFTEWLVGLGGG